MTAHGWDGPTAQAHLILHGWWPAFIQLPKQGNFLVVTNKERWFLVQGDAIQTGAMSVAKPRYLDSEWERFSDAELLALVEGMEAYGELYD